MREEWEAAVIDHNGRENIPNLNFILKLYDPLMHGG